MANEAKAERQRRSPSVGCQNDRRSQCAFFAPGPDGDASHATRPADRVDQRPAHANAILEFTASRDRRIHEDGIQFATDDGPAALTIGIQPCDTNPAVTGDEHAVDAQAPALDRIRNAEPPQ
jgi:hypothetical protein